MLFAGLILILVILAVGFRLTMQAQRDVVRLREMEGLDRNVPPMSNRRALVLLSVECVVIVIGYLVVADRTSSKFASMIIMLPVAAFALYVPLRALLDNRHKR